MLAYAARRLALLIPLLLGVVIVVFAMIQVIPGDPAAMLLGQQATPAAVSTLRHELGLDRPLPEQLLRYVASVVQGDLGRSIFRDEPVVRAIAERAPATIELATAAIGLAVLIGVTLGTLSALDRGGWLDTAGMALAQLGVSLPVFWLGILLMFWFAVTLGWLPSVGRGPDLMRGLGAALHADLAPLGDSLRHLLLPAVALSLSSAAVISRLVRASLRDVLGRDFARTARAKGLSRRRVILLHGLRNALLPVANVLGVRFGELLGGAVLTESVFGWPGLGQLGVTAIGQRDIPLVQGVVLLFALIFAIVTLGVDLLNAVLDPRVRVG